MIPSQRQLATMAQGLLTDASETSAPERGAALAIRWPSGAEVPEVLPVGEEEVPVRWAASELALRELLHARPAEQHLVVLTPLEDSALAEDVRGRLVRRRIHVPEVLDVLARRFRAAVVAPSLRREPELARAVLDHVEDVHVRPLPGGVLDREGAVDALLRHVCDGDPPRPAELVAGSSRMRVRARALPASVRDTLARRLGERLGPVGRAVGAFIAQGNDGGEHSLLSLAVASEAVTAAATAGVEGRVVGLAEGRLPAWLADGEHAAARRVLGDAAGAWLAHLLEAGEVEEARRVLDEAEAAVGAWGIPAEVCAASSMLRAGLEARRERLCRVVERVVEGAGGGAERGAGDDTAEDGAAVLGALREARDAVGAHVRARLMAAQGREGGETAVNALAALAWRVAQVESCGVLGGAGALAGAMMVDGAEEDALRFVASRHQEEGEVGRLLGRLGARSGEVVAERNRVFAREVAEALGEGRVPVGMLAQEHVLERVVAPLVADRGRVLLLVMDGMDWRVARKLLREVERQGLAREVWVPSREGVRVPVLAMLPTVTEVARASLLSGAASRGGQAVERSGLQRCAALMKVGAGKPVLFHKDGMGRGKDGGALGEEVRRALGAEGPQVVACVVNAVDDQLSGAEQVTVAWSLERVRPLEALLREALEEGRRVVVTSDHGHVWVESEGRGRKGSGQRWREADGEVDEGEVLLDGPRVREVMGGPVVVPWREEVRYKGGAAGAHGGCTLQEAVVPLAVLLPAGEEEPPALGAPWGWAVLPVGEGIADIPHAADMRSGGATPRRDPRTTDATDVVRTGGAMPRRRPQTPTAADVVRTGGAMPRRYPQTIEAPTDAPQLALIPPADEKRQEAPPAAKRPAWVDRLAERPDFVRRLGRAFPAEANRVNFMGALVFLAERGTTSIGALAAVLGIPQRRVFGLVSTGISVVNRDGYPVLKLNREAMDVTLNVALLRQQFEVTDDG